MAEFDVSKVQNFTKPDLLNLGIYDLRELGRELGVCSPTTLKKEELVDAILLIIYGESPKKDLGKGRGRPARRGDKPNKLILDLIEKVTVPDNENIFVFGQESEDVDYVGMVASSSFNYASSENQDGSILKKGIVCFESNGLVYIRNYKFIASKNDVVVPLEVVKKYDLKDNDIVEFISFENNKLGSIIKVNDILASEIAFKKNQIVSGQKEDVVIKNIKIQSNKPNLVVLKNQTQKQQIIEGVLQQAKQQCKKTVGVYYNKNDGQIINQTDECYCLSTNGDEYESLMMAERAVDKVKMYKLGDVQSVLIIDDFKWLIDVVGCYPKALYGSFIQKVLELVESCGATIICFVDEELQESEYYSIFNVIK